MDLLRGAIYLIRAMGMLYQPGLRRFIFVPFLINAMLFATAISLLWFWFSSWVEYLLHWVPDWLSFLGWLFWAGFAMAMGLGFGCSIATNLIAAPFNGLLAQKVQQQLTKHRMDENDWQHLLALLPRTLDRELNKLWYYLPRFLGMLLISCIPLINLAAPLLWLLFGGWMMGLQYVDYPINNNGIQFRTMRQLIAKRRALQLGLGTLVALLMTIPLLNWFVMPVAVVGATQLWIEQYSHVSNLAVQSKRN